MIQQPRSRKDEDRKIRQQWSIHPAISYNGKHALIATRLGPDTEIFIPHKMAINVANALIDAVETGTTTRYRNGKQCSTNDPNINSRAKTRTGAAESKPPDSQTANTESESNTTNI